MILHSIILTLCLYVLINAQGGPDDLYIMIEKDGATIRPCDGVRNLIPISRNDVSITDENGNNIPYIKAPGRIRINFNNINVVEGLPNLSGELSALLQVPLLESSFIRFDFPYSVIPEKKLLKDVCDRESGVVTRRIGNQEVNFCRYCELCNTAARTENFLDKNKNLPNLEKDRSELSFRRFCNRVTPKTYSLRRTIELPGKRELERQANQRFNGIDGELKKRFNRGKGKFRVRLHLLSSNQPARSYQETQKSRCRDQGLIGQLTCGLQCNVPFLGEDCKAYYAENCVSATKMASCYNVEFFYRITDNYNQVRDFLRRNGLRDTWASPPQGNNNNNNSNNNNVNGNNNNNGPPTGPGPSPGGNSKNFRRRCVQSIRFENIRLVCGRALQRGRWNPQCCRYCPGICKPGGK